MPTTPRILIVDDFDDTAALLGHLLARVGGYETRTATNGLEAIRIAQEFRPEFVLLDIGMPNLNGFETAKRIRKQPWSKGMVLIAISAQWKQGCGSRAKKAGFAGYLLKPMSVQTVTNIVREFSRAPTALEPRASRRQCHPCPVYNWA